VVNDGPTLSSGRSPTSTNPQLSDSNMNLISNNRRGLTPTLISRLTVGRNLASKLTVRCLYLLRVCLCSKYYHSGRCASVAHVVSKVVGIWETKNVFLNHILQLTFLIKIFIVFNVNVCK
jgi:hypothetical protein